MWRRIVCVYFFSTLHAAAAAAVECFIDVCSSSRHTKVTLDRHRMYRCTSTRVRSSFLFSIAFNTVVVVVVVYYGCSFCIFVLRYSTTFFFIIIPFFKRLTLAGYEVKHGLSSLLTLLLCCADNHFIISLCRLRGALLCCCWSRASDRRKLAHPFSTYSSTRADKEKKKNPWHKLLFGGIG